MWLALKKMFINVNISTIDYAANSDIYNVHKCTDIKYIINHKKTDFVYTCT